MKHKIPLNCFTLYNMLSFSSLSPSGETPIKKDGGARGKFWKVSWKFFTPERYQF